MSNCNCHTNIIGDGTGQLGRYLKALDPAYAPIDDRSIEDLLVFAKRYAAQIRFYDMPDEPVDDGRKPAQQNWREFFRRDMAVIAASIGTLQVESMKAEYEELRERLADDPSPEKLAGLFALSIAIAVRIDRWYTVAIPGHPLHTDLTIAINTSLREQLRLIMAYEEGFKFGGFKTVLHLQYDGIENDALWGLTTAVEPDAAVYEGTSPEDKLRNASLYADDVFNTLYSFLQSLIHQSDKYFTYAMEQYPAHQPYMALFIAFLKMFGLAQQQMNGLTDRMLDFYYKEVLQLTAQQAVPDKAHVVFELAKDVLEYAVAKDTPLDAGKDAANKELVYSTVNDLVVNQAKVKELKTIFIQKEPITAAPSTGLSGMNINSIYARPVANSADGFGAAFAVPNAKWPTFGKGMLTETAGVNPCAAIAAEQEKLLAPPPVQTGFAIASPQLLMQGGSRLTAFGCKNLNLLFRQAKIIASKGQSLFELWLTGETGWVKVTKMIQDKAKWAVFLQQVVSAQSDVQEPVISYFEGEDSFMLYLPPATESILSYDIAIHGDVNFSTTNPVMQFRLNPLLTIAESTMRVLKTERMAIVQLIGSIGNSGAGNFNGLKKLVLQNETGLLEAGKPFYPFTGYPGEGKSLYIGSSEIFNKTIFSLSINIEKVKPEQGDVATQKSPEYRLSVLDNRQWVRLVDKTGNDFTRVDLYENVLNITERKGAEQQLINPYYIRRSPVAQATEWSLSTSKGFFRIDSKEEIFIGEHGSYILASQNKAPDTEIKEVSISYISILMGLVNGIDQFFHVYPFGSVEVLPDKAMVADTQVFGKNKATTMSKATGPDMLDLLQSMIAGIAADTKLPDFSAVQSMAMTAAAQPAPTSVEEMLEWFFGKHIDFNSLDKAKGYLLVDANNLLLPQYTYLGPYEAYNKPKPVSNGGDGTNYGKQPSRSYWEKIAAAQNKDITTILAETAPAPAAMVNSTGGNQYSALIQEEGMLFIGLENAAPLQSLSLLFHFAEGSAADEDNAPPVIHWSYLTHNEWRPMRGEDMVSDGTYGFQTTGIVRLNLPADATNNNTIITTGLYWLCASVTENSHRIPQLISVVTQAAEVMLTSKGNDAAHFAAALPAGTISKLVSAAPAISKVQQPFAGYDGKPAEVGREFYTRVSERLRHKNRAITARDFESLVLNRFPAIYKVKCIIHTDPECLCRRKAVAGTPGGTSVAYRFEYNPNGGVKVLDQGIDFIVSYWIQNANASIRLTSLTWGTYPPAMAVAAAETIKKQLLEKGVPVSAIDTVAPVAGNAPHVILTLIFAGTAAVKKCCGPQVAPGHVLIVPISNLKNRNAVNPLQPKTGRRTLLAIEAYLQPLASPFVKIHAKNPVYEQIIVGFRVQFYTGTDKGYYLKKLNEEIVGYLTPWAFDENADVSFGQKIYASAIVNFIEERPYVDFITDFVMGVCKEECCPVLTAGTVITLTGKVIDGLRRVPVPDTLVLLNDVTGVKTDKDGYFSLPGVKIGQEIVVKAKDYTLSRLRVTADVVTVRLYREGEQPGPTDMLSEICGCNELEQLIEGDVNSNGKVAVAPSGERVLLVSAAQHVIIPYEEKQQPTLCERRRATNSSRRTGDLPEPPVPEKPLPATVEVVSEKPVPDTVGVAEGGTAEGDTSSGAGGAPSVTETDTVPAMPSISKAAGKIKKPAKAIDKKAGPHPGGGKKDDNQ